MSSQFKTHMQATVRVPQDGFTVDELKAHLRASKIPADARLLPTTVKDVTPGYHDDRDPGEVSTQIGFIAEWTQ